jgi:hypothetical protein
VQNNFNKKINYFKLNGESARSFGKTNKVDQKSQGRLDNFCQDHRHIIGKG